jgi:hypothetical protein
MPPQRNHWTMAALVILNGEGCNNTNNVAP